MEAIHRRLHARRVRYEHPRQQALHRLRIQAKQGLGRQIGVAVVEGGHNVIAQRHAVIAGHLGTLLRSGGGYA
jgi:hypothetical protein